MVTFWACENSIKPEETKIALSGTIIDSQNLPVPFAIVSIFEISSKTSLLSEKKIASDTTDEDGKYDLSGIPESMSNLVLKVNHPNFPEFASGLNDLKGAITSDKKLPIKMDNNKECNASLNFVIKDKLSDLAIKEAQIRVSQNGTLIKKAYTNTNGTLTLSNMCEGTYSVRVAKDGYAVVEKNVTVVKGDSLQLVYPMLSNNSNPTDTCCGGSIGMTVNDENSKALNNVNVKITLGDKLLVSKLTNDLGKVSFDKLCEGSYNVKLFITGYEDKAETFSLGCNAKIENISFQMKQKQKDTTKCCNVSVTINLKDSSGKELNGKVKLLVKGGEGRGYKETTNGTITFKELCDGDEITAYIAIAGYEPQEVKFTAKCNENITKEVVYPKLKEKCCTGVAVINLVDSAGNKLNGKAKLMLNGDVIRNLTETKDGTVTFKELCEGDVVTAWISVEGYDYREVKITIKCDSTVTTTVTYAKKPCCEGKFIITLKDSLGNDLKANYRMTLNGSTFVKEGKIEGPNQAIIGLCEGTYEITFTSENTEPKTIKVVITCATPNIQIVPLTLNGKCCEGVLVITPTDSTTLLPLNGGTIRLYKGSALVGTKIVENGKVRFDKLCEGEYSFSFSLLGYKSFEAKVIITCKDSTVFPLLLNKSTCCDNKLSVYVKDLESNRLSDVSIDLALNDKVVKSGVTNGDGNINFTDLCEGTYVVRMKREGYRDSIVVVTITCGKAAEVLGRMKRDVCCNAVVTVIPKDSLGNVLNGASVKIYQSGKEGIIKKVENGKAVFEGLCEGEYIVLISKDGYSNYSDVVLAKCDAPKTFEATLKSNSKCCNGSIKVKLLDDSTSSYLVGAYIKLMLGGSIIEKKTTTNDRTIFTNLCEGEKYSLYMYKDGYTTVEYAFTVKCNEVVEVEKRLMKNAECCSAVMKFVVKDDSTNTSIANAKCEILLDGKVLKSGNTSTDGYVIIGDMCKKNYTIKISKDGYKTKETTWNITSCTNFIETFKLVKN